MSITNLEIKKFSSPKGNMLGTGKVTIANTIEVNFTIIKGAKGIFASLPSHKGKNKETGDPQWYTDVRFTQDDDYSKFQSEVRKHFDQNDSGETNQDDSLPF